MDAPSSDRAKPPTPTMRQRLRDGIAPLHERLDSRITAACLSPWADLRRLLAVHAGAFPPVVAGLQAAGAERLWPDWDGPARLALLSAELDLGVPLGAARPSVFFDTEAKTWGGLYALLGSRLGNRVIVRRLADSGEPANSAFLQPGAHDRTEWRRFLHRLESALGAAAAATHATCDDAIEGAALVMERYLDAVERLGCRAPARIGEALH
jgi:heme oxygenase (biliverdin-IX-beta and delta-forming)